VIDLHCHLLPGIDDGPATLEDSLALARAAAAGGTRTMVATPHIDHRWNVDPATVPAMVERMSGALADAHIELEVRVGGEIALSRLGDLDPQQVQAVRLGGGPYMLLECPHRSTAGTEYPAFIRRLRDRGESIVLAHPERSPTFQRNPDRLAGLVRIGVLTSITAGSLLGTFGSTVQSFALRLLREGLVHNVASDSHEATRRGPEILAGLQAAERELPGVLAQADWLTRGVPEAVLAGTALPARPELPPRRGGVRRWLDRLQDSGT
jgi:protein-tyrosine phosphatase